MVPSLYIRKQVLSWHERAPAAARVLSLSQAAMHSTNRAGMQDKTATRRYGERTISTSTVPGRDRRYGGEMHMTYGKGEVPGGHRTHDNRHHHAYMENKARELTR